jgi:hypothetical protein
MSAIFFLLWVVILVGLAGFVLQNLSLFISLAFLGLRSQPIPLGFLIVGAIAAGVFTGLVIMGLLKLSNHLTRRRLQRIPKTEKPRFRPPWQAKSSGTETTTDNQTDYTDSWSSGSDSWDNELDDQPAQAGNYEVEQQPKTTYQSGSTYSYSYRDDNQTGVGRPEPVVEADYRVITPPYRSDDTDDDYGFDDEDFEDDGDFDDEDNSRKSRS